MPFSARNMRTVRGLGPSEVNSFITVLPGAARSALVLFVLRADTSSGFPLIVDDVVFAPEPFGEILTLPAAASVPGAFGQRWATDLWVRNTAAVSRVFSLRIACPSCGQNPTWIVLNLGPSETRFFADVVFDFLGGGIGGRAGAIEISYDPREGGLDVFARAATVNADGPGKGGSPGRGGAGGRASASRPRSCSAHPGARRTRPRVR